MNKSFKTELNLSHYVTLDHTERLFGSPNSLGERKKLATPPQDYLSETVFILELGL